MIKIQQITNVDNLEIMRSKIENNFHNIVNLNNLPKKKDNDELFIIEEISMLSSLKLTTLFRWNNDKIQLTKKIRIRVFYSKVDLMNILNNYKNLA